MRGFLLCSILLVKGGGFDIEWGQINVSPSDIFWPSSDTELGRN